MSVSARARALVRWRRGLAVLLLEHLGKAVTVRDLGRTSAEPLGIFDAAVDAMLAGRASFDVSAARALATELIALEDEHAVFTDWTLERGKGPDNREPGAFVSVEVDADWTEPEPGHHVGTPRRGGWPGKLAREWGTVPCGACKGGERGVSLSDCDVTPEGLGCGARDDGQWWHVSDCFTTWVWCEPCKGTGRKPKPGADRRAPQGRSLARVGRRLRDMLDGKGDYEHAAKQPDECGHWTAQDGQTMRTVIVDHVPTVVPCGCHGTGHNLRGYLPEVEVSAKLARNVVDATRDLGTGLGLTSWQRRVFTNPDQASRDFKGDTRVGDRGAHTFTLELGQEPWEPAGSPRVHVYTPWGQEAEYPKRFKVRDLAPRWRRGELLHAQQRRERAQQRDVDAVREEWSFGHQVSAESAE